MERTAFMEKGSSVDAGRYCMRMSELMTIMKESKDNADAIICAFNYGFLKGQRSVKNSMKKRSMEVSQ